MSIRCVNYAVCGTVIERPEVAWFEVIGWVKKRKGGGTHALFNERATGEYLCDACQLRLKFTGQTGQGGLFDE